MLCNLVILLYFRSSKVTRDIAGAPTDGAGTGTTTGASGGGGRASRTPQCDSYAPILFLRGGYGFISEDEFEADFYVSNPDVANSGKPCIHIYVYVLIYMNA